MYGIGIAILHWAPEEQVIALCTKWLATSYFPLRQRGSDFVGYFGARLIRGVWWVSYQPGSAWVKLWAWPSGFEHVGEDVSNCTSTLASSV